MTPFCESWRRLREQSNTQSPFFTLPPEIRNRVYDDCPLLDLLGLCRHIRRETLPRYMSTRSFSFETVASAKQYLQPLPDCAIKSIHHISFDVPISDDIFLREDCRIVVVFDKDAEFVPWKTLWVFREDPGQYHGKLKGRYELAEVLHSSCWLLTHAMDVHGMDKVLLTGSVDVLEMAGRMRGTKKGRVRSQREVANGEGLEWGVLGR